MVVNSTNSVLRLYNIGLGALQEYYASAYDPAQSHHRGNVAAIIALLIGLLAGFALYHAAFGFTAGWRNILRDQKGAGLRMQFILIFCTSLISYPLIAYGDMFGVSVSGAVAPIGVALFAGAFLFGFGMIFGGGCGSGTLFTVGGGSNRMVFTLIAFVAGSLLGTYHLPWWQTLPKVSSFSIVDKFGGLGAILILGMILGLLWAFTIWLERRRHGFLEKPIATSSYIHGPWSPLAGAIALAVVGVACFVVLGRPWGITSAFALWGAKIAVLGGIDVANWPYWQSRSVWLNRSIFEDSTSVMNLAIMIGAMLASSLAGKYHPKLRLRPIELATAIIGGLAMGYGARLAYGCNIGAYLGGIVSGSGHGWLWMVAAFCGSALAIKVKNQFKIT